MPRSAYHFFVAKPAAAPAKDAFDAKPATGAVSYYFPKELSILEIREDAVIDRRRSRLYFDIQSLWYLQRLYRKGKHLYRRYLY